MRIPLPDTIPPADSLASVHFVGIGGAALSGLARIMWARGVLVSGSDGQDSQVLEELRMLGVRCEVGHAASHLGSPDVVVVSTAIRDDNCEVQAARDRGLALWPRAAAVQSVLLGKTAVVVTGTHGKTTTTALLTTALIECGADPSYAIGATLIASGVNAADGTGSEFVVEGDESDGAILAYTPAGAIVTNVDADHLDVYGSAEAYADVFEQFLARIQPGGFLVCCVNDPGAAHLADIAAGYPLKVVRVGFGLPADASADLGAVSLDVAPPQSRFRALSGDGDVLGTVTLAVSGQMYELDALAALGAGLELGYPFHAVAQGLAAFHGTSRRMELKGSAAGVTVYDSYAHHPREIAADLQAARRLAGSGRVVVCFQPHLYSRTLAFAVEMGKELGAADAVVVMDVYAAREDPVPGVSGALVAEAVPLPASDVTFEPARSLAAERVVDKAGAGDLVLTLGAGDVTTIAPQVLHLLATRLSEGAAGGLID